MHNDPHNFYGVGKQLMGPFPSYLAVVSLDLIVAVSALKVPRINSISPLLFKPQPLKGEVYCHILPTFQQLIPPQRKTENPLDIGIGQAPSSVIVA